MRPAPRRHGQPVARTFAADRPGRSGLNSPAGRHHGESGFPRIAGRADVAQLVERRLPKPKVASSSLVVRFTETIAIAGFIRARSKPGPEWLTPDDAAVALRTLLACAPVRKPATSQAPTFSEVCEEWLRHGERERQLKPSTWVDYRAVISARLAPALGSLRIDEITPQRLGRWRAALLDEGAISHRTINKLTMVVGAVGQLVSTKGDRVRSVPLVPQLASSLSTLHERTHHVDPDDPVFCNETGERLDGSALRRRFITARTLASLRPLRLHDLRHSFASLAMSMASPVEVQAWAGHRDARTTARYTHYNSRTDKARRLSRAFGATPERTTD